MIKENRTSKYLLYAIGEIVLVVIGILIALSINNWNENRKDLIAETKIINDLKHEFLNNKTKFDKIYKIKSDALTKLRIFIELMNATDLSVPEITEARRNILGVSTYNPSNGVINSLIATGQINLIKNDSLKYLLTNWKDNLLDYQEEEIAHAK